VFQYQIDTLAMPCEIELDPMLVKETHCMVAQPESSAYITENFTFFIILGESY
jgi:hypothetical protein